MRAIGRVYMLSKTMSKLGLNGPVLFPQGPGPSRRRVTFPTGTRSVTYPIGRVNNPWSLIVPLIQGRRMLSAILPSPIELGTLQRGKSDRSATHRMCSRGPATSDSLRPGSGQTKPPYPA